MTLIQYQKRSDENHDVNVMGNPNPNPLFRSESFGYYYCYYYPDHTMMEKRQLFLRSYQFCRKKSLTERIKGSLVRVKKVVWRRLRSTGRLNRFVFSMFRIKCGFYYRKRCFSPLLNRHNNKYRKSDSSCFC
ncbi:hypothetical protein SESBI_35037 [Sesbania bispinosa]|nr:hypothetical protein SESBI_35037 [Sesbania bispinosa]